jgi:outer membrane receptor protein involved in Fe transport
LRDNRLAPRWGVELVARIVANQNRAAVRLLEQPTAGFTTYDLRAHWQATERLLVIGGVENLTDKFYRDHLDIRSGRGVYRPGMNAYVGAELTY